MDEKINGRTPEEIKAGLKACTSGSLPGYGCNISCPYLNVENGWFLIKRDALALIERLESEREAALAKVPKWISVEERLPEGECLAIGWQDEMLVGMVYQSGDVYECESDGELLTDVTHWMPLPEPTEESL